MTTKHLSHRAALTALASTATVPLSARSGQGGGHGRGPRLSPLSESDSRRYPRRPVTPAQCHKPTLLIRPVHRHGSRLRVPLWPTGQGAAEPLPKGGKGPFTLLAKGLGPLLR